METIRGKTSLDLDSKEFRARLIGYDHITLDLGTGDGRFVNALAKGHPEQFVVGVDACRENLREHSRVKLPNMLFVIACAQQLPWEFEGLFSQITINFPWGSLLDGLLARNPGLMYGLYSAARPDAQIAIHLNGDALKKAGASLDGGAEIVYMNLHQYGWKLSFPHLMQEDALKKLPSTWARRLAHGRDPQTMILNGRRA
jgi:16S rRNA (adenine(1408)-N(1))-methyltransferase